jgi:putative 4-mercaptohistidine N1-methyltranferase
VHPWYDDFSVPTFDLQHNIIKGGSWISTGNEASNLSRYAFRRHFMQHAGFRYVESQREVQVRNDIYERDSAVTLYAEMHYGPTEYLGVKNYPQAVAAFCAEVVKGRPTRRALDMGCAVGRATFELAHTFDYVVGLDFSARFIRMGVNLKEHGAIHYSVVEEGSLTADRRVTLEDLNLSPVKDKVEFFQADACNLDPRYNNYDLVLASNMIDRLYDPRLFLNTIRERINVGGLLVILDPYTWLEEHTPKECWLGGFTDRFGNEVSSLEALKELLAPHFRLVAGPLSFPCVLREHKRKFQYLNSEATCWERVQ